jgi:hypothetical protein
MRARITSQWQILRRPDEVVTLARLGLEAAPINYLDEPAEIIPDCTALPSMTGGNHRGGSSGPGRMPA